MAKASLAKEIHAEKILVLDFGSQYTQLIARRIREQGVFCEIHPYNYLLENKPENIKGVIFSGGLVEPVLQFLNP